MSMHLQMKSEYSKNLSFGIMYRFLSNEYV